MNWILVIVICWGFNCQTIYEEKLYDTELECNNEAARVMEYAQEMYPNSSGEVHCLTSTQFEDWIQKSAGA